jgi:hypothetical protein
MVAGNVMTGKNSVRIVPLSFDSGEVQSLATSLRL